MTEKSGFARPTVSFLFFINLIVADVYGGGIIPQVSKVKTGPSLVIQHGTRILFIYKTNHRKNVIFS